MVQVAAQRVQALGPELLVTGQPHGGLLHGLGRQGQIDDTPVLGAGHQAGVLKHAQMLHEAGQGHAVRLGQLADGEMAALQVLQHLAACRVRQCGEHGVQGLIGIVLILNHLA